jgi:hypothetical protein
MVKKFHIGDYVVYDDPETGETKYGIITSIQGDSGTITPVVRIDRDSAPEHVPGKPAKFLRISALPEHETSIRWWSADQLKPICLKKCVLLCA